MYTITIVARFGNNLVKRREWVRDRRVVSNPKGGPGATMFKEYRAHEYMVFIGVDADDTTCFGHQTRCFGSKADALRYAKNTKPVDRLAYSVGVA